MVLRKWNYKKHDYETYIVPDDWKIRLYSDDLEEVLNCASCGKEVKFGDTYSSKEIHTSVGMGFCICEKCHNKEWLRRNM